MNFVQINQEQAVIRRPLIISFQATVKEAIVLLKKEKGENTRVWVVGTDQQLLGSLTAEEGLRLSLSIKNLDKITLTEFIKPPLITLQESAFTDIFIALKLFQKYPITHLPLVGDRGELRGIITTESILKAIYPAHLEQNTELIKQRQIEKELRESRAIKEAILSAIPNLMYRVSAEGIYLECFSTRYVADLQPSDIDPIGKHLSEVLPPELAQRKLKMIEQALATGEIQKFEQQIQINQLMQYEEVQIIKMNDRETLTIIQNIGDRKRAEKQIVHNALHDALTSLPNRTLLMERIELAIKLCKRVPNYHYALLFIDVDRFKVINESLGPLIGDQLLKIIAKKLTTYLQETGLVARIGGDEFVILLEDILGIEQVIPITEKILKDCQTPIIVDGYEMSLTTSIGIVLSTPNYGQASDLLRDADIAMCQAKNQGGNNYKIFNIKMHTQALSRLTLETEMRQALKREEFVVYYQPIIDILGDRLVGFEALVRWQNPVRGLIYPDKFIPIAEETGLIVALDSWVFHAACKQLAQWKKQFTRSFPLKMSINLAVQDLCKSDLIYNIDQVLAETGLDDCKTDFCGVVLEITEGTLIEDINQTIALLSQLKERKMQISIDDFGTGYSSLNYLHRLPADNLKIDRSFINQMQQEKKNYQIVSTIIALSNQLELAVIAEGIETFEQLQSLKQLGCEFGQGYLFSKPLVAQEIEQKFLLKDCLSFCQNESSP